MPVEFVDEDDPGLPDGLVAPVEPLEPLCCCDCVDGEPPLEPCDPDEDDVLDVEPGDSCGGNGDWLLLEPPDCEGVDDELLLEPPDCEGNGDCWPPPPELEELEVGLDGPPPELEELEVGLDEPPPELGDCGPDEELLVCDDVVRQPARATAMTTGNISLIFGWMVILTFSRKPTRCRRTSRRQ